MDLSNLKPPAGAVTKKKRVGRGNSSGWGRTAGRGEKGAKARAGGSKGPGFEGGQMPVIRRMPKFGFKNFARKNYAIVNLRTLAVKFPQGGEVTPDLLVANGVLNKTLDGVKILSEGDVTMALNVTAHKISAKAKEKIEAAGGSVTLIEVAEPVKTKRNKAKLNAAKRAASATTEKSED
ncbi:MAG: 50S ribosomal protein L15 [Deltaproteobacteria bacterium]|nr:50S ribosomal protein L15 [Deltaproteobacteria bacterium]MCB9487787.1 50S ribosomal protein L15 [Deltaproteobacteria bacterium]